VNCLTAGRWWCRGLDIVNKQLHIIDAKLWSFKLKLHFQTLSTDRETFIICKIDESIKGATNLRRYGITFDDNINMFTYQ
jgi:hypothetical protein